MRVGEAPLAGVLVIEPRVFRDARGHFLETWHAERYAEAGVPQGFVQDNVSCSRRGVLRGMHFQNPRPQAKLVSVLHGTVFDVVVDLRVDSATFGRWWGTELDAQSGRQLYVPEGFAHGFVVLSETAIFAYKCSDTYAPACERAIRWDDPDVGIEWPVAEPSVSEKDASAPRLRDVLRDHLFAFTSP